MWFRATQRLSATMRSMNFILAGSVVSEPYRVSSAPRVPLRELGDRLVEDVVLVDADHAEAPPGASEVLREGVDEDRVVREVRRERAEAGDEGAVDVVGQDHEVRTLGPDDLDDLVDGRLLDRHRGWVGRVDDEERLDGRVFELLDLLLAVLPGVAPVLGELVLDHLDQLELEVLEPRHLDVRA